MNLIVYIITIVCVSFFLPLLLITNSIIDSDEYVGLFAAFGTWGFFLLLISQIWRENKEHRLDFRPMIVLDMKRDDYLEYKSEHGDVTTRKMAIRLINVGKISTGRVRVFALPLVDDDEFNDYKQVLGKHLKKTNSTSPESNESCRVLKPVSEAKSYTPSDRYLIIGSSMKELRTCEDNLNKLLKNFKNGRRFVDAVNKMNRILLGLPLSSREILYQSRKNGDLLRKIGPIYWEGIISRGILTKDDISKMLDDLITDQLLGEDAINKRRKVIDSIEYDKRQEYLEGLDECLNLLDQEDKETIQKFILHNMALRYAYYFAKEIHMTEYLTLVPTHQFRINVPIDIFYEDLPSTHYFGLIVQYGIQGSKSLDYSYFVQGHVEVLSKPQLDYTQDSIDFKPD